MTYAAPRRAYPAGMVRFTAALPLIDWSRHLAQHVRHRRSRPIPEIPPLVKALLPKYGGEVLASDTKAVVVEGMMRTMNVRFRLCGAIDGAWPFRRL